MTSPAQSNSLGLDFDNLRIKGSPDVKLCSDGEIEDVTSARNDAQFIEEPSPEQQLNDTKEKKKPYVNRERVRTGGPQRDKLSEEELSERIAKMKEQNEKIKQRRLDVQADEDAFKKSQESERLKQAQIRKVQEQVNRTRQQNERRKMDKIQSREWDVGKPTGDWKLAQKSKQEESREGAVSDSGPSLPPPEGASGFRGRHEAGKGRGRCRGKVSIGGSRGGVAEACGGQPAKWKILPTDPQAPVDEA